MEDRYEGMPPLPVYEMLTPEEVRRRNEAYEASRRKWRDEHPIIAIGSETKARRDP